MVENDPSVMDLLQGRVIDVLGIIKTLRAEGDLEYQDMLEIHDFVEAEIQQDAKDEQAALDIEDGVAYEREQRWDDE